jgi:hypothetical protein
MDGADVKVIFAMGKAFGAAEKNIRVILDFLETLPRGAVIATAELVECWEITDIGHILDGSKSACVEGGWTAIDFGGKSNIIYGPEILFGDWREGRYAWELANVKPLAEPISVRGRQGLWDWEER